MQQRPGYPSPPPPAQVPPQNAIGGPAANMIPRAAQQPYGSVVRHSVPNQNMVACKQRPNIDNRAGQPVSQPSKRFAHGY